MGNFYSASSKSPLLLKDLPSSGTPAWLTFYLTLVTPFLSPRGWKEVLSVSGCFDIYCCFPRLCPWWMFPCELFDLGGSKSLSFLKKLHWGSSICIMMAHQGQNTICLKYQHSLSFSCTHMGHSIFLQRASWSPRVSQYSACYSRLNQKYLEICVAAIVYTQWPGFDEKKKEMPFSCAYLTILTYLPP